MKLVVLGSAAGGGVPQWNCGCENCRLARAGSPEIEARTQDSVAVTADGDRWLLLNASPDVARQLARTPALHPRGARHSPVAGVVLTNGDLDHVLGLLVLREWQPLTVFATEVVWRGLVDENRFFRTLERFAGQLQFRPLAIDRDVEAFGLTLRARAAPGKLPVHRAGATPSPEDNVAIEVSHAGRRALYATAVARAGALGPAIAESDLVLFDGTFFTPDELSRPGLAPARAEDMAHWPIGGEDGSLVYLAQFANRRMYTHINNTNPILRAQSPERRAVERAGVAVAHDGLELEP